MDTRDLVYTTEAMQGEMHGILANMVLGVRTIDRMATDKVPEDVASFLQNDLAEIQMEGAAVVKLAEHLCKKIFDAFEKCEGLPDARDQDENDK